MSSKAEARAAIYNRLASAPTYHPASADLFTDWTLQGGDIVTVTSDEESYTLPIFGMNINWTGKTKVKVESSGNEMRDSIENMAQKQAAIRSNSYRRGRTVASGLNEIHHDMFDESGYLHASINATASEIRMDMQNAISGLQSSIVQTASAIYSSVSANNSQIYTFVEQTASGILSEIVDTETGLMNYINNTASGTRQIITNFTNKMWIQENDPTTAAGGSHTPKEGDMWVESTHQGSWDGAEGFDWEHDENFDWFQIQGAKIWGWANDKWELISDQQQTISYSELINTCDVFFSQKFKGIVNDEGMLEIYLSKLEQTAFEIKAEVSAANSTVYSYIHQTASNINMRVGETPRTVVAKTQPTKINNRDLQEGDVWVESEEQENWDKAEQYSWGDDSEVDWNQLRSDKIHVYHNGEWVEALDGTTLIDDADLEIERGTARLYARKLEMVDGQLQRYYAELKVDANQIKSQVNEYYNQLGSSITQTASQIRSDVFAANSKVYSYILQTASGIRTEVGNEISGVYSVVEQTASSISSYVYAAQSTIYSSIQQTASGIRSEVGNVVSGLQSTITQNADKIGLVVEQKDGQNVVKTASIVAAINDSGSSINLNADKIVIGELSDKDLDTWAKDAKNGTGTFAKFLTVNKLTAQEVKTVIAGISEAAIDGATIGSLTVSETMNVSENLNAGVGSFSEGLYYKNNEIEISNIVKNSNNTLTIYKTDGTSFPFDRAISTWTLGGGNGYVNVTALPQNQMKPVQITIDGTNTITSNGTFTYKACYVNADGDDVETGTVKTVTVNVSGGGSSMAWDVYDPSAVTIYNTVRCGSLSSTVLLNGRNFSNGRSWWYLQENNTSGRVLCQDYIDMPSSISSKAVTKTTPSGSYLGDVTLSTIDTTDYKYLRFTMGGKNYYFTFV